MSQKSICTEKAMSQKSICRNGSVSNVKVSKRQWAKSQGTYKVIFLKTQFLLSFKMIENKHRLIFHDIFAPSVWWWVGKPGSSQCLIVEFINFKIKYLIQGVPE